MVKLSVSKAARMLGISRFDIQNQINSGKLQTHEGYVTTDSLRLAYPSANLHSEQDKQIQKMQKIKNDALLKAGTADSARSKNEAILQSAIKSLKQKIYQEEIKNQHYETIFAELTERLQTLEKCCHAQDKAHLHALQAIIKGAH